MGGWGGEWLPKAFVYSAVLATAGVLAVRTLLWRLETPATGASGLEARLARIGVISAIVVLLALLGRALFYAAAAFGWSEALSWENLRLAALESRWGQSWRLQASAAAALVAAALAARRWSVGWIAYFAAAAGLYLAIPLLGHAAGSPARYLLHSGHLIGGGVWLGSLAVLIGLRRSVESSSPSAFPGLIRRFSPLALSGASAVFLTGLTLAVVYVGSMRNLAATAYGRLLLLKIVFVVLVAGCGRLNWGRVRAGETPFAGVMLAEALAAVAVVIVTSLLTQAEHP